MPENTTYHAAQVLRGTDQLFPERLNGGLPILLPEPEHAWENRVVLNPAAALIEENDELNALCESFSLDESARDRLHGDGAACVMLYRAQGQSLPGLVHAPSSIGLAIFTPFLELIFRSVRPVLEPCGPDQNLGVEDPRCTKIGDTYYLYYTGHKEKIPAVAGSDGCTHICLATTKDFTHWDVLGPVAGEINEVQNKNAALFPEKVHGLWRLLHRPMEGPDAMSVHLATSESPAGPWSSAGVLFESCELGDFEQSWIGAGGPPIALGENRFLIIYHRGHWTRTGTREYDLGAALLDFEKTPVVRSRIEPFMRPEGDLERSGDPDLGVDDVLFTCANYRWDHRLIIPYAGADSRIFGASIPFESLITALERKASHT